MDKQERINFYTGPLLHENINSIPLNGDTKIDSHHPSDTYDVPLRELLVKTNNYGKKLNYVLGDNGSEQNPTVILKTRGRGSNSGVILRCLQTQRHWGNYYKRHSDIDFNKKQSRVVWRGTTTGNLKNKGNRFDLVTRYHNKRPDIDVGFSFVTQGKSEYSKYVKGSMSIPELLQYKYIISIEGNDKDSGINWKLNSNSLIMMPRPQITSWLMETTLVPSVHYILLNDDFSDLEDKITWCEANPDKCEEIVKNAKVFMEQFSNCKREEDIEVDVINAYFDLLSASNSN